MNIDEELNASNKLNKKDSVGKITGFFLFRNLINNYNIEKTRHEEERKQIKKYGISSLILSLISLIISVSCLISRLSNITFVGFSNFLMILVYIFSGIIISLILSIYAFVFGVLQVRLNRKSIGIIGLVLSILSILSSIVLLVFLII